MGGYIESDEVEELKKNNSVAIYEQETCINFMRDEDFATEYTSDSTEMTVMDKLCKNSPNHYQLIADTGRGRTYKITPKSLISHRSKIRIMSEEQKKASGERMKVYQASKNNTDSVSC